MNKYNKGFYLSQMAGSISSAKRIVPYVLEMLSPVQVTSVVDFGCGVGGWLSQFQKNNASIEVLGLDFGNPDKEQLQISERKYRKADLSKEINLGRKFGLCISLEVAEHIHSKYADNFIDNLCRHSDFVLFSAAIPGQGGTEHVNEQPLSYWVKKFKQRGYLMYDIIRPFFWDDRSIDIWYRQNTVLFIKNGADIEKCHFKKYDYKVIADIVHPEVLHTYIKWQTEKLINRKYLYVHNRKLYDVVRKIKRLVLRTQGGVKDGVQICLNVRNSEMVYKVGCYA